MDRVTDTRPASRRAIVVGAGIGGAALARFWSPWQMGAKGSCGGRGVGWAEGAQKARKLDGRQV